MSSNCASEFSNVYTTIQSISGNMTSYTSNVLSTYSILNQMVSNQSNINAIVFNSSQNLICGNIITPYVLNTNGVGGNVRINSGNVTLSNGNLLLSGKISLGGDYGSAGQVLVSNGNTLPSWRSSMTRGTTQSMSGTSVPLTGIPSWANEVIIMIINGSTNGTFVPAIQLGITSGTYITSGYSGTTMGNNGNDALNYSSIAYLWNASPWGASNVFHCIIRLHNMGGNTWGIQINSARIDAVPTNKYAAVGCGTVTLTGQLDRIRITTTAGTDSFDAGSISIMYQ